MEIFKLFNPDWPHGSRKNSTVKCSNCEVLSKQIKDKHEVLMALINKGKDVQNQLQESQEKEMELKSELDKSKYHNEEFLKVLNEYDRLLNDLIRDCKSHKTDSSVTSQHLMNLEFSFSDVHSKYERAKQVLEGYKENELILLESIKENEKTILELQNRYETLKENTTVKLQEANETLHNIKEQHMEEIQKYKTRIRMLEFQIDSLDNNLKQKIQENQKLSSICDDFVNKC